MRTREEIEEMRRALEQKINELHELEMAARRERDFKSHHWDHMMGLEPLVEALQWVLGNRQRTLLDYRPG